MAKKLTFEQVKEQVIFRMERDSDIFTGDRVQKAENARDWEDLIYHINKGLAPDNSPDSLDAANYILNCIVE